MRLRALTGPNLGDKSVDASFHLVFRALVCLWLGVRFPRSMSFKLQSQPARRLSHLFTGLTDSLSVVRSNSPLASPPPLMTWTQKRKKRRHPNPQIAMLPPQFPLQSHYCAARPLPFHSPPSHPSLAPRKMIAHQLISAPSRSSLTRSMSTGDLPSRSTSTGSILCQLMSELTFHQETSGRRRPHEARASKGWFAQGSTTPAPSTSSLTSAIQTTSGQSLPLPTFLRQGMDHPAETTSLLTSPLHRPQ